jgi:hypothetical protein
MQSVKKQLEILLMNYFRESCPGFPKGKVVPWESPDFIVKLKSRNNLGVELTRLNPINAREPDEAELRLIQSREQIIESARSLFEGSSPLRLFVKFLFSENNFIAGERKLSVAVKTANAIRQVTANKLPTSFFCKTIGPEALPSGLETILVIHHPEMQNGLWERSNNLGVSENVVADIRESIHKKDEKLKLYQKHRLNYYWLIITTDRLRGVKSYNLPDKILNQSFESRFQHVFLFDLIKSDVFQLV